MFLFMGRTLRGRCSRMPAGIIALALGAFSMTACESPSPPWPVVDPDAEIAIQSPLAGDRYAVGEALHVKWKTLGKGVDEVNAVNIEVSPDSGKSWFGLLDRSIGLADPRWGNYAWTVPAEIQILGAAIPLAGRSQMRVRVMQYGTGDPNKKAVTPYTFAIAKD